MKIGNIYQLDTMKGLADQVKAAIQSDKKFADSAIGVVLARNLTQVDPKIFEKKYPELAFANSGITVDNTGGYANRIQSLRIIEQGDFTTAGDNTTAKGRVSLQGETNEITVTEKEIEAIWTNTQVEQAALQNLNLVALLMTAIDKIYKRKLDAWMATGVDGKSGSYGLLNHSSFTADVAGANITDATAAADDFAIIKLWLNAQRNAVNNTPGYVADRVVLPVSVMNSLMTKYLNTANASNVTVLEALQRAFPGVEFMASARAESVSGTKRGVAYSKADDVSKFRMPLPLQIGEVVRLGSFDFKVDGKCRPAGLDVLEATGGRIITGL